MSATRYAIMMRRFAAIPMKKKALPRMDGHMGTGDGWMG
jgi:hypothetical protein